MMGSRRTPTTRSDLHVLATRHGLALGRPSPAVRTIHHVGFDGFSFDDQVIRRPDGAAVQRGVGSDGTMLAVGAMRWPDMPIDWLALSSRRSPDLLALDDSDSPAVGNDRVNERFRVDTDDEGTAQRLLDAPVCRWLIATDDGFGPIHVVLDGPDAEEPHVPTIYVAREVVDDQELVDTLDLAVAALHEFDHAL